MADATDKANRKREFMERWCLNRAAALRDGIDGMAVVETAEKVWKHLEKVAPYA